MFTNYTAFGSWLTKDALLASLTRTDREPKYREREENIGKTATHLAEMEIEVQEIEAESLVSFHFFKVGCDRSLSRYSSGNPFA